MELLLLLAALLAAGLALRERLASRKLLGRLERMLEQAMDASFQEEVFDESRLSALESSMVHWLGELRAVPAGVGGGEGPYAVAAYGHLPPDQDARR